MRRSSRRFIAPVAGVVFSLLMLGSAAADSVYTVKPGDTLSGIAALYGVTVEVLAQVNGIADPDVIFPGQVLQIPGNGTRVAGASTYVVQPGDTVSAIAQRFGITVEALSAANGLADPDLIVAGQTLEVPGQAPPPSVHIEVPSVPPDAPEIEAMIEELAAAEGVDARLVKAIALIESGWNQNARSAAGAVGVMQLMPDTAAWLEAESFGYQLNEDVSVFDNVKAGCRLLRVLLENTESEEQAIASYYQGHAATLSGVMYDDTRAYVSAVLEARRRFWP
jgi:LysM repeat protein